MTLSEGVADLHMHTTASDGTCSVADRIDQAHERDLAAIAITDHNTISDDLDGRRTTHDCLEVISGIELRADVRDTRIELLGYYVDPDAGGLSSTLETAREHRRTRNRRLVARLREVTNLDRTYESIRADVDGILGRPHVAAALVTEGIVDSVGVAFSEYLGDGGEAFVPLECLPASEVIGTMQAAGGVVSLAHPGRIHTGDIESVLADLVDAGLDAIEVKYPYGTTTTSEASVSVGDATALAADYGLLRTGGSDCHGPDSGKFRIGEVRVAADDLDALRGRATDRQQL